MEINTYQSISTEANGDRFLEKVKLLFDITTSTCHFGDASYILVVVTRGNKYIWLSLQVVGTSLSILYVGNKFCPRKIRVST
jgi:hypothetical protein